jgi:ATP-dependent helicase/nuclease subunit A
LHLLLERLPALPRNDWPRHAAGLIGDAMLAAELLTEAQGVLDDPALAPFFVPGTLAEVGVSGDWNGLRLTGTVDRLVIGSDHVLVMDYKSNILVPPSPAEVPEGILRQLGAYAHVLGQIYPDRRVETVILWTRQPCLMPIPLDIVRAALARTTIPSGGGP